MEGLKLRILMELNKPNMPRFSAPHMLVIVCVEYPKASLEMVESCLEELRERNLVVNRTGFYQMNMFMEVDSIAPNPSKKG
jgi:hypothetical protein